MSQHRKDFIRFMLAYHVVFLIPMLLLSVSTFHRIGKQQQQRIKEEIESMLSREKGVWGQQLKGIEAFRRKCKFDRRYNDAYSNTPDVYFSIFEDLKKQETSMTYVDHIFLYDPGADRIFSSTGEVYPDFFWDEICPVVGARERMTEETEQGTAVCLFPYAGEAPERGGLAVFAKFQTWGERGPLDKTLIFMMSEANLSLIFGENPEDTASMLLYDNKIVYASSALELLTEPGTAPDEGWLPPEYISYREPLGDRMDALYVVPKVYSLRKTLLHLQFYFIWLFSSLGVGLLLALCFSRARFAMFQRLMLDRTILEDERDALSRQQCLYKLLITGVSEGDSLWNECMRSGIRLDYPYKCFLLWNSQEKQEAPGRLSGFGSGGTEVYSMRVISEIPLYFVCSNEKKAVLQRMTAALCAQSREWMPGEIFEECSSIRHFYHELQRKQLQEQGSAAYPEQTLASLRESLSDENGERAVLLADQLQSECAFLDAAAASCVLWECAQLFSLERPSLLKELREEADAHQVLLHVLEKQREFFLKERKKGGKSPAYTKKNIVDIIRYIHEHYLDADFSTKTMAAYFEVSVSNISHFFKANMGQTITAYVTSIKLEKAKELLTASEKTVAEIASILQYSSSTVFIEMFKKNEGTSPGNFRVGFRNDT